MAIMNINKKVNKVRSIRIKLIFLLSFSAAIAMLLSSAAVFLHTYNTTKQESVISLTNIAHLISHNLTATIEFDDADSATSLLSTLIIDKNIDAAFVFKSDRTKFASFIRDSIDKDKLEKDLHKVYSSNAIKKDVEFSGVKNIIVCSPIYSDGENIATFCIVSNTKKLHTTIIEEMEVEFVASMIALVIIIILGTQLQKIFTRPIFALKDFMDHITQNHNYSINIDNNNNDEFHDLFDGFNKMIDKINTQNIEMQNAKLEIEEIHKHTRESIEYAALIQSALIPGNQLFRKYFKDFFAIWHPKDMVGGDIYLFEELRHDECLLMVIDCTGHGVSGAFVTMLVKAIERQVVAKIKHSDEVVSPSKILSIFNSSMKHLLKQEDKSSLSNAGFDGQIMYYNKKEKIVTVASAKNDIFYYQDDGLKVIKGDRHSVGYKDSDINFKFKEHTIDVSKDTTIYISSDGYWDQNGGEKGLPFGKRRLKIMLEEIHMESMADQQEEFLYTLANYKGKFEDNDDVTVIGIKI